MRPYLAIIRDSFREALASRILWVLLILISLFLLVLAPLGYRSEQTTTFQRRDFLNGRKLVRRIRSDFDTGPNSPGYHIWSRIEKAVQRELTTFANKDEGDSNRRPSGRAYYEGLDQLIETLNGLLSEKDLYTESAWKGISLGTEAREMIDQETANLSLDDLSRLNRLLIEKPYVEVFRPSPPRQVVLTYFSASISPPLPLSERRVMQLIEKYILPGIMGVLVGFLAVFIAILVTAPVIPHMFDPGSLNLLLSKPLSRSLMFIAKFLGGCAFILINITLLIFGLWLIAGLRFGIWNHGLLLCIPIFLFLFALYYSVSALTGVIWRNAVLCVVMTIVFWLFCTIIGSTKVLFEQFAVDARRISRLVPVGEDLFAVDEQGVTKRWDPEKKSWEATFIESGRGPSSRLLGPIYDPTEKVLLAGRTGNRSLFGTGEPLQVGRQAEDWMASEGPDLPDGTFALLADPKGRLLAINTEGIWELTGDLEVEDEKLKFFFMEIPKTLRKPFQSRGPTPALNAIAPTVAAIDGGSTRIAILSRNQLTMLDRKGNRYEIERQVTVNCPEEEGSILALGGDTLVIGLSDGRLLIYDSRSLDLKQTVQPETHSQPRFLSASADGRWFAVVFHNAFLYVLDTRSKEGVELNRAEVRGQGDISAATFTAADKLMVVDQATRATEYQLADFSRVRAIAPPMTALEIAYHYAIVPIYMLAPKPGELGNTVQYVLKGDETLGVDFAGANLEQKRVRLRPWTPVTTSFLFLLVIMAISCIYIERQDF